MKIKISRSFSKKIQLAQFEPIESFCGAEQEVEDIKAVEVSAQLDYLCRTEVEKTLENIKAEKNKAVNLKARKLEKKEWFEPRDGDPESEVEINQ